jgi:DNA-binding response OmpR family regulator
MRILLVEDEKSLALEIQHFLKSEGEICDISGNLRDATENLAVNPYDFVLLDLGLPDGDGLELLEEIAAYQERTSVIIITARSEVDDRVKGLQLGADDYISKPFSLVELKARMQAILRRKSGWHKDLITIGVFDMDLNSKSISFKNEEINLTRKEFTLLHFMIVNKNRVLNRFQLSEHLWGDNLEDEYQSNYIDVHIKNIRKKLGQYGPTDWLETVRGLGYKIKA